MKNNIVLMEHPLIKHKISMIRDKNTGVKEFREMVSEISMLMLFEATREMPLKEVEIETPIGIARAKVITGKKLALIPILRAGLGMVDGVLNLIPAAKIGHIGEYRDPESMNPIPYYCKLPHDIKERESIILDPMLATGGTLCAAIQSLKEAGCLSIKVMTIIASKDGLERVSSAHPDVEIFVGEIDEKLNSHGYIVPGLGDAGDRMFGTK